MSIQDTEHRKHAALARPAYGTFHTREWAALGAPCGLIQKLAAGWIAAIGDEYPLGYVDADHPGANDEAHRYTPAGAAVVSTDRIGFDELRRPAAPEPFRRRHDFAATAGALINGNHFAGKRQIVLLDSRKRESLSRKLDRLTDVGLFLRVGDGEVWDFLREELPHWADIPRWEATDVDRTAAWLRSELATAVTPVRGLVLAGGRSQRMGTDKGLLDYHGQPQRRYLYDQLHRLGIAPAMSCRHDQADTLRQSFDAVLPDTFTDLGPFGAILSAFRTDPTAAWLVVACDLPLLDAATLRQLIDGRDPNAYATAFHNPATGFPEPLVAIWEPRAYGLLLQYLAQGYSCPRKALINSPINTLQLADARVLLNANRPEEAAEARALLRKSGQAGS